MVAAAFAQQDLVLLRSPSVPAMPGVQAAPSVRITSQATLGSTFNSSTLMGGVSGFALNKARANNNEEHLQELYARIRANPRLQAANAGQTDAPHDPDTKMALDPARMALAQQAAAAEDNALDDTVPDLDMAETKLPQQARKLSPAQRAKLELLEVLAFITDMKMNKRDAKKFLRYTVEQASLDVVEPPQMAKTIVSSAVNAAPQAHADNAPEALNAVNVQAAPVVNAKSKNAALLNPLAVLGLLNRYETIAPLIHDNAQRHLQLRPDVAVQSGLNAQKAPQSVIAPAAAMQPVVNSELDAELDAIANNSEFKGELAQQAFAARHQPASAPERKIVELATRAKEQRKIDQEEKLRVVSEKYLAPHIFYVTTPKDQVLNYTVPKNEVKTDQSHIIKPDQKLIEKAQSVQEIEAKVEQGQRSVIQEKADGFASDIGAKHVRVENSDTGTTRYTGKTHTGGNARNAFMLNAATMVRDIHKDAVVMPAFVTTATPAPVHSTMSGRH